MGRLYSDVRSTNFRHIGLTPLQMTFFESVGVDGTCHRQLILTDIVTLVWLWAYSGITFEGSAKAAGIAKPKAFY